MMMPGGMHAVLIEVAIVHVIWAMIESDLAVHIAVKEAALIMEGGALAHMGKRDAALIMAMTAVRDPK